MKEVFTRWYQRYLSEEEAVLLLVLLATAFVVMLAFGGILAPVFVAVILFTFFDLEGNPIDKSLDASVIFSFLNNANPKGELGLVNVQETGLPPVPVSELDALLLRIGGAPTPSAADTRWRVTAAPSAPLPGNGPGRAAFALTLLRRRAGSDGQAWRLVWDRDRGSFGDAGDERHDDGRDRADAYAPLSGAELPLSAGRSAADRAA